jgi:hypothetical protein
VRGRFIKTKIARLYDLETASYFHRNYEQISKIKHIIKDNNLIQLDTYFVFHKDRLIGKNGQIKKIDSTNRLKASHDTLMKILDLDDKQIIKGHFEKVACDDLKEEQVIFQISLTSLLNLKELEIKEKNETRTNYI